MDIHPLFVPGAKASPELVMGSVGSRDSATNPAPLHDRDNHRRAVDKVKERDQILGVGTRGPSQNWCCAKGNQPDHGNEAAQNTEGQEVSVPSAQLGALEDGVPASSEPNASRHFSTKWTGSFTPPAKAA